MKSGNREQGTHPPTQPKIPAKRCCCRSGTSLADVIIIKHTPSAPAPATLRRARLCRSSWGRCARKDTRPLPQCVCIHARAAEMYVLVIQPCTLHPSPLPLPFRRVMLQIFFDHFSSACMCVYVCVHFRCIILLPRHDLCCQSTPDIGSSLATLPRQPFAFPLPSPRSLVKHVFPIKSILREFCIQSVTKQQLAARHLTEGYKLIGKRSGQSCATHSYPFHHSLFPSFLLFGNRRKKNIKCGILRSTWLHRKIRNRSHQSGRERDSETEWARVRERTHTHSKIDVKNETIKRPFGVSIWFSLVVDTHTHTILIIIKKHTHTQSSNRLLRVNPAYPSRFEIA